MSDLISRGDVIKAIANFAIFGILDGNTDQTELIDRIVNLPSIDAVPVKHGVWVTYTDGMMHCSNCSKIPINRIYALSRNVYDVDIGSMMKYCPNCGAIMDGES